MKYILLVLFILSCTNLMLMIYEVWKDGAFR